MFRKKIQKVASHMQSQGKIALVLKPLINLGSMEQWLMHNWQDFNGLVQETTLIA